MLHIVKKRLSIFIVLTLLVCSGLALATSGIMPRDPSGKFIPVFTPVPDFITIAGAGDVTVSSYEVISFDTEVTIYFGTSSTKVYVWPANRPLGIMPGVTTIHVDAACGMAVM